MKTSKKTILTVINFGILGFAIFWYMNDKSYEPIIVFLGQIASLITLSVEKKSKIITKKLSTNANVDVDVSSGDNVHTSDIDDSEVKIRTH